MEKDKNLTEYQGLVLNNISAVEAKTFKFKYINLIVSDNDELLGEITGLIVTVSPLNDTQTHLIGAYLAGGNNWTMVEDLNPCYGYKLKNAKGDTLEESYFPNSPFRCHDKAKTYTFGATADVKYEDIHSMSFIIHSGRWKRC